MAVIGVLAGLIVILLSDKLEDWNETLKMVGQSIITISLSSLILEWFGYVNYTRKRMCEILVEDEVIQVLNMKRKKELKSALIKNIYMYNAPSLQLEENNISTIIDNEMDNILRDYYFEEYIIYIDISISEHDGTKYLKKKIRHTFTAKTINRQKCTLESPLSIYLKPPIDGESAVKIISCSINGKKQEPDKWILDEENNSKDMKNSYTKHYTLKNFITKNKKLFTFKERFCMDFEYTTLVNIDDLVYSYQVSKACKHFCLHINSPSNYKILMEGFGFMSTCNSQRQRVVETENGCMIRFLDWILPGNGIMAVLQEK